MIVRAWHGETSKFPWEQEGLNHIKNQLDSLSIPYYARQCFSFTASNGAVRECDLLIAVPAGFFLLELKAHRGRARNSGSTWSFDGDGTIGNPLHLTDQKSKELKGQLKRVLNREKDDIPFLEPAVFLSAPDLVCEFDAIQRAKVYGRERLKGQTSLDEVVSGLLNRAPQPNRRTSHSFYAHLPKLLERIGVAPIRSERYAGVYRLEPKSLASGPTWQDFLAANPHLQGDEPRRVRVYLSAQGATEEARASMRLAAEREYKGLIGIAHPGIVGAETITSVEDLGPAVVLKHGRNWQRLSQFMATDGKWRPLEERVAMIRQLADALRHAHDQKLYHRALAANSVWVEAGGDLARLRIADWQGAARRDADRVDDTTSWTKVAAHIGTDSGGYIAPEAPAGDADPIQLDVFGLGALAYLILTGTEPAETRDGLAALLKANGGLTPSTVSDDMTPAMDALVRGAACHHSKRFADVTEFMAALDLVEAEVRELYDEDPLTAGRDDLVGKYRIKRVLGTGGTGRALLAVDADLPPELAEKDPVVLKVAHANETAERALEYEAEVLNSVRGSHIVELLEGPIKLGGRTVLIESVAGDESLAQYLRKEGRLTADELKGWGQDLLRAMRDLEDHEVRHRDVKPGNLAVGQGKSKKRRQLFLFDFSLAATDPTNIEAGTRAYLDPFLGPPRRNRYDTAAELWSLSTTLYEMATAELPTWGDGLTDPADLPESETVPQIRVDAFDPTIADGLKAFFLRALQRDPKQRFTSLEDLEAAFGAVFRAEPKSAPKPKVQRETQSKFAADLPLSQAGLSPKALMAAHDRLNVDTVEQLTERPATDITGLRGVGLLVRNELLQKASEWRARLRVAEPQPSISDSAGDSGPGTVDAIAAELIRIKGSDDYRRCVHLLLGLPNGSQPSPVPVWSPVDRIESASGLTSAQIAQYRTQIRVSRWEKLGALTSLRSLIAEILTDHGRIMEATRLAAAVLARRASGLTDPEARLANAGAVVYAAVHVEDSLAEPRYMLNRGSDGSVLVALCDAEDLNQPTEQELFEYAAQLSLEARRLVASLGEADPLPQPAEAIAALRACASLEGLVMSDTDLVRLAADSNKSVAVTPRLELYPTSLDPKRVVSLTQLSAYLDGEYGANWQLLIERVRARFGDLDSFPGNLAELTEVLAECGFKVEEVPDTEGRDLRLVEEMRSRFSSTRASRSRSGSRPDDPGRFARRLETAVESGGFRAIKTHVRTAGAAAEWIGNRPGVLPVDVQAVFLGALRECLAERGGRPTWETVVHADTTPAPTPFVNLLAEVWRRLEQILLELGGEQEVLFLYNATPLARYEGGRSVLQKLIIAARRPGLRPHGLWLQCPTDSLRQVARLDTRDIGAVHAAAEEIEMPTEALTQRSDVHPHASPLSEVSQRALRQTSRRSEAAGKAS
ncbi:BREX system serine/threonine kinase PglW [Glycomyces scopariae]